MDSPYKGLSPYTEEDFDYFFGRDIERRIIAANLRASRLTLLYGESGVGKSSVLWAGVGHDFKDNPNYVVVIFRNWRDEPVPNLARAISNTLRISGLIAESHPASIIQLLPNIMLRKALRGRTLLLILDQFEEYFQYHAHKGGPGTLVEELPNLVGRDELPVNVLISIREDALATLDRFKGSIPNLFDNYLRIEYLSREAAKDAISKPLKHFYDHQLMSDHRITIDDEVTWSVVEKIIDAQGAASDRVQTPYLQLVMSRWWEREVERGSHKMHEETLLKDLGGVRSIVDSHLKMTIDGLTPSEQEIVAKFFVHLVTPSGRKIALTVSEIAGSTGLNRPTAEGVLEKLRAARVLNPVPPPRREMPEDKCYEFTHDVVAKVAADWLKNYRQAEELALAQRKADEANRHAQEMQRLAEAARNSERIAVARERIAFSLMSLTEDVERSLLLAMHAIAVTWQNDRTALPEAEDMLHRVFLSLPISFSLSETNDALCIAWSPVGNGLAIAIGEMLSVYDAASGRRRLLLSGHTGSVLSVAWSLDGKRLVTASEDQTAKVWDAETGQELVALSDHQAPLYSVAWSPDSKRLVTASEDQTAKVWDAETGQELLSLPYKQGTLLGLAWSADGKRLAVASDDQTVKIWDVMTGRELISLSTDQGDLHTVAWDPNENRLVTAGDSCIVKIWDASSGHGLIALEVGGGSHPNVVWSPDGQSLATFTHSIVELWDAETGSRLIKLASYQKGVSTVVWSPNGKYLATASNSSVRIWEATTGREWLKFPAHGVGVGRMAWSPDGKRLATADYSAARIWEVSVGRELLAPSNLDHVTCLAWSPSGSQVVTGGPWDARVWEVDTGKVVTRFSGHEEGIRGVAWSLDEIFIATSSYDGTVRIWEALRGREAFKLTGHHRNVLEVAWSPRRQVIVTVDADGTVRAWSATTGQQLQIFTKQKHGLSCIAWSPDGKWLATVSRDEAWEPSSTIAVWDPTTSEELFTISHREGEIRCLAWSRDGSRLAIGSTQGAIKVLDSTTGRELFTLLGHEGEIKSIAWSPDEKRLVSGGTDGNIKLWDTASRRELLELSAQGRAITLVAWSPDGKRLSSILDQSSLILYAMDIDLLMSIARQRLTRNLTVEECRKYLHMDECPPIP